MLDGKPVSKSSVTLVMDGSRGLKYTYVPDKKAKDDGANTVACISEPMSPTDGPTRGGNPTTFVGEVFTDDRVTEAFFDPAVAKPAGNLLFIDPFRQEPVATYVQKQHRFPYQHTFPTPRRCGCANIILTLTRLIVQDGV